MYKRQEVLATTEEQDIERTYEVIVDTFRVKPINWTGLSEKLFRAHAPQSAGVLKELLSKGDGV